MHLFTFPCIAAILVTLLSVKLHAQLPVDFYDQELDLKFEFPVGLTFDDKGRMFVWEKEGKVFIVDPNGNRLPEPLIDISEEVANWKDHGLMGFALDPAFSFNGKFYLLYAVDLHHHYYFGTSTYHPDTSVTNEATIGRVASYQATPESNFSIADLQTRNVLLGETLENGIPILFEFHGLGSLIVGEDGTLLISSGDATSNKASDTGGDEHGTLISDALAKGIITTDQDVGSYKAQYLGSYNGKILRIDPTTGNGLPSNPFFDPDDPRSAQSRIWAIGFRNPYRIVLMPESGSHFPTEGNPGTIFVGDVGNGLWEELDIVPTGGLNYGWPVTEGHWWELGFFKVESPLNQMAPNPLHTDSSTCDHPYFSFRELLKWPLPEDEEPLFPNPCASADSVVIPPSAHPTAFTLPVISWSNQRWNPPIRAMTHGFDERKTVIGVSLTDSMSTVSGENFGGYSSLAGVFYTADRYPEAYRGKFFGVDYAGWIKVFDFDEDNELKQVSSFHDGAKDIIHLGLNPKDGNLYYVNIKGAIRKITYGAIPPPIAVIEADKNYGPAPLTVQFDASASKVFGSPLASYLWDFGDGDTSTVMKPKHTFSTTGSPSKGFTVKLTVTDSSGVSATTETVVSVNNTPPSVEIASFREGDQYPVDKTTLLRLAADVVDREHPNESLEYEWRVFLHHNDHYHPDPVDNKRQTYTLISPLGCTDQIYWYRIALTVTDPGGLSTSRELSIYPYCGPPLPTPIKVTVGTDEEGACLRWKVPSVARPLSFEVQRSIDFFHFQKIGTEQAHPSDQYSFVDRSPRHGSNVYRIKVRFENGAFAYSNLVSATFPSIPKYNVFPNPASEEIQIELSKTDTDEVHFDLFTPSGRRILSKKWDADPQAYFLGAVDVDHLRSGLFYYFIRSGSDEKGGTLMIAR